MNIGALNVGTFTTIRSNKVGTILSMSAGITNYKCGSLQLAMDKIMQNLKRSMIIIQVNIVKQMTIIRVMLKCIILIKLGY